MNILLLGSGGREHAFAWKIAQSNHCSKLFIAPGNAGTAQCGINVDMDINDFKAQLQFCLENNVSMIVVGPEEPLVRGIYDYFENNQPSSSNEKKIKLIAPSIRGAQLEGSKAFAKKFMKKNSIPTANYAEFNLNNFEDGEKYISKHTLPVVLKADGLAAGKGVVICNTAEEALNVFEEMIINKQFGEASSTVVVEEFLDGIEVSVFVITDGKDYKIIGHAKDYKRIGEGDTGANTGGMGCISPVPFVDEIFMQEAEERIIKPTIKGLQDENIAYKGFIFFGLINVDKKPYVIEYNCRMGDPETEVVMPRLKNDLVELFNAVYNDTLKDIEIKYEERTCATIVAVSGGYPGEYRKHLPIKELSNFEISGIETILFHAGTKVNKDGIMVTNGGRVLAVTSFGNDINEAVKRSKDVLDKIYFEDIYYRKDIGYEFM